MRPKANRIHKIRVTEAERKELLCIFKKVRKVNVPSWGCFYARVMRKIRKSTMLRLTETEFDCIKFWTHENSRQAEEIFRYRLDIPEDNKDEALMEKLSVRDRFCFLLYNKFWLDSNERYEELHRKRSGYTRG